MLTSSYNSSGIPATQLWGLRSVSYFPLSIALVFQGPLVAWPELEGWCRTHLATGSLQCGVSVCLPKCLSVFGCPCWWVGRLKIAVSSCFLPLPSQAQGWDMELVYLCLSENSMEYSSAKSWKGKKQPALHPHPYPAILWQEPSLHDCLQSVFNR